MKVHLTFGWSTDNVGIVLLKQQTWGHAKFMFILGRRYINLKYSIKSLKAIKKINPTAIVSLVVLKKGPD